MEPLYAADIHTVYGIKRIEVYASDVTQFDEPIDILTTSAFYGDYVPVSRTVFGALEENLGISVMQLSKAPAIDLRAFGHVWLSQAIPETEQNRGMIRRVGCIELTGYDFTTENSQAWQGKVTILQSVRQYFRMLKIAERGDLAMETVALPMLGTGSQWLENELITLPLIRECMDYLHDAERTNRILFIERSPQKAFALASALQNSYTMHMPSPETMRQNESRGSRRWFLSHSGENADIIKNMCLTLESHGQQVWYTPRDLEEGKPYPEQITRAIYRANDFAVLLTEHSMRSFHVLNEVDMAFGQMPGGLRLHPIRLNHIELTDAFRYYFSALELLDTDMAGLSACLVDLTGK